MSAADSDFEVFVASCLEILSGVEQAVLDLERAGPAALGLLVERLFRAAHSLKGDAATVGLAGMAELAHAVEDALTGLRNREIEPGPAAVDALLAGFDALRGFVARPRAAPHPDVGPEMRRLAALAAGRAEAGDGRAEQAARGRAGRMERIHVPARILDELVDRLGELSILRSRLVGLAAELGSPRLNSAVEELGALAAVLHGQALSLRLVPLSAIFARFRRLVRDLCARLGKEADLTIEGGEIELDKGVIERLAAPLSHLVRNAVDHGLEDPAGRERAGKPRAGKVAVSARQAGSEVLVEVADDGAGIDAQALLERARELGLAAADADPASSARLEIVFLPGLSTAARVDEVSGRGVGMDAVREAVLAMRGDIAIHSAPGRGTTFRLRFPLSLAIMDCLRILVAGRDFFVPLDHVEECLELPEERAGERSLSHRGALLPLIRLREVFGLDGEGNGRRPLAVVVRTSDQRAGLVVDAIVGQHQAVIKDLGKAFGAAQGVLGAAVLEDG